MRMTNRTTRILLAVLVSSLVVGLGAPGAHASGVDPDEARAELARRGIEYKDDTPIHLAYTESVFVGRAGDGNLDVVDLFLDAGIHVDARDYVGNTALMEATGTGATDVAMRLLEAGADPNIPDPDGRTPLIVAAHFGWLDNVRWAREGFPELRDALIAKGADVNARDMAGVTALVEAAHHGDAETVATLLARGADPARAANDGTTALRAAAQGNHGDVARMLIDAGAPTSWWQRLEYRSSRFARLEAWWGPLVVLVLVLLAFVEKKRPARPKRHAVEQGDSLPRLAPLKCPRCAAPVPITPTDLKCPSCGTEVVVPDDYAQTLGLRAESAKGLRRAVWTWRRARVGSSVPVIVFMLFGGPAVLAASLLGALGIVGPGNLPMPLIISALMMGVTFGLTMFCAAFYLMESRGLIPAVPKVGRSVGEAETSACSLCGAPVAFASGQLVTGCGYCGGEIYRVALARRARAVAADEATEVAVSIYDTMVELQERRRRVLGVLIAWLSLVLAVTVFLLWQALKEAILSHVSR
jgi:hypothetical protein